MYRIFFLALLMISGMANAAGKSDIVCLKMQENSKECDEFEIHIVIETGKDAGLKGGYDIVSIIEGSDQNQYWTEKNGWTTSNNEYLLRATAPVLSKLEPIKEFVIFKGTKQQLCKLSNQKPFSIHVSYHGFSDVDFNKTLKFTERFEIKGPQLENFWNSIMVYKAGIENKVSLVYFNECKS
jgi:hypothetical protein